MPARTGARATDASRSSCSDIGLGVALLGLAYLRTRSLTLPIGLPFGWNWTQGAVFGFGVSGYE